MKQIIENKVQPNEVQVRDLTSTEGKIYIGCVYCNENETNTRLVVIEQRTINHKTLWVFVRLDNSALWSSNAIFESVKEAIAWFIPISGPVVEFDSLSEAMRAVQKCVKHGNITLYDL